MERLRVIGLKAVALIGCIILFFLTIFSWIYTIKTSYVGPHALIYKDSLWKNLLFIAIILLISYFVGKLSEFLSRKLLHILAVAVSVILVYGLFRFISAAQTALRTDSLHVFLAAEFLREERFEELANYQYFQIYSFQLQISKFEACLLNLFHQDSYQFLKYVNAVMIGISYYIGYLITGELFRDIKAQGLYLVCTVGFVPMYMYVLFVYGESMGVGFAMLGLYFFLLANREPLAIKWKVLCWANVACSLWGMYIMKSALIIVWIAIAIIQLSICVKRKNWHLILPVIFILVFMLGGQKIFFHSITEQTGLSMETDSPSITWIAMGLQRNADGAGGVFNGYNWDTFIESGYNVELTSEMAWDTISERLKEWAGNPVDMIVFFKDKLLNQWIEPSYDAFICNYAMDWCEEWVDKIWYGDLHEAFYEYLDRYQSVIYFLFLGYFITMFKEDADEKKILPGLILIGGVLFSILWESCSRYAYPYMVLAMPCAAGCLASYKDKVHQLLASVTRFRR